MRINLHTDGEDNLIHDVYSSQMFGKSSSVKFLRIAADSTCIASSQLTLGTIKKTRKMTTADCCSDNWTFASSNKSIIKSTRSTTLEVKDRADLMSQFESKMSK